MRIGTFTPDGNGFSGQLHTLNLTASLTLEPNRSGKPKAPDFRVMNGVHEIGYGYQATSDRGVEYVSIKLDDPAFAQPVYCSLFPNAAGDNLPLVWNRRKVKAA